jgi:hypothetical protein
MADVKTVEALGARAMAMLEGVWIPVGLPGSTGAAKARRTETLDRRFGPDGWRFSHVVRGAIVPESVAIAEYEESYRVFIRARPAIVEFLASECGNVYDWGVDNVYDDSYEQPGAGMNHYQDIAVRRVIAELVGDDAWPSVAETDAAPARLLDIGTGAYHTVPRSRGMSGRLLLQIRDPQSPGFMLSPAVVPAYDPALLAALPGRLDWYHTEGCAHLSVEAFWQMSKVLEVRYDRFIALGPDRVCPLKDL